MSLSYLLISSAYRDRLLYPNPADFVIQYGTINNPNVSNLNVFFSTNPISFSLPDYNFCWTNYFVPPTPDPVQAKYKQYVFKTLIVAGTASAPLLDTNVNMVLLGIARNPFSPCSSTGTTTTTTAPPPNFSLVQEPQYCFGILSGWVIVVLTSTGRYAIRDILEYDPSTRVAVLRNPLPDFSLTNGPLVAYIANLSKTDNPACPTTVRENYPIFANDILGSVVFVNGNFLARSSQVYFNYAVFLYDVTINEIAVVQKFQSDVQVFTLCQYFSCAWQVTDQYWVLSRNLPMAVGSIVPVDVDKKGPFYNRAFIEDYTFLERGRNYVLGQEVELVYEIPDASDDVTLAKIIRVGVQGSVEDIRFLRISKRPYRVGDRLVLRGVPGGPLPSLPAILVVRNTSLVFRIQLKPDTFRIEDFVGNYLISVLASPQYQYEPHTRSVYLSPNATIPARNLEGAPVDLLRSQNEWGATGIRKVVNLVDEPDTYLFYVQPYYGDRLVRFDIVEENLSTLPLYFRGWNNILITQFSTEGVVPLNYTGSQITQSQMTCQELTVMNLILPNKIINSPQGLLTSAYPYVFLEISNETMPSGHNRAILYSNNPFAVRATFVCSISDVNNPRTTRFIKISSDGASQVLKFSPYDNLRLRVTLPNGQPFLTEEVDTLVPCEPDVSLQISVVFQINRL
jgi:hypothetical protein